MNFEEYESESENALVQSMDYFSDEQLKNELNEEDILELKEQRETECQNIFGDISLNKINNNRTIINNGPNLFLTL